MIRLSGPHNPAFVASLQPCIFSGCLQVEQKWKLRSTSGRERPAVEFRCEQFPQISVGCLGIVSIWLSGTD
jgi:hypothetical protein